MLLVFLYLWRDTAVPCFSVDTETMVRCCLKGCVWQVNLLVATKVGEEGLDIQTCCLVIRFDLPETLASFIQSRGRARMPKSEYAFLVDRYENLLMGPLKFG